MICNQNCYGFIIKPVKYRFAVNAVFLLLAVTEGERMLTRKC